MLKFRMLFDKDAETEWLNSMAQNGWAMTGNLFPIYLKHGLQIIVIVLMAAGVYTTMHCRRK